MGVRQAAQFFIGSDIVLRAVDSTAAAAFIQVDLSKATRTVVIQLRIEMSGAEALDLVGMLAADISIVAMFANDGPFLPSTRALSELWLGRERVNSAASLWSNWAHLMIDELRAIVGMKNPGCEKETGVTWPPIWAAGAVR